MNLNFPKYFIWGAGVSSYQTEEENFDNDFSEATRLGRLPSPSGETKHNHYFTEDIDTLSTSGLNSYKFSIEWSKIEPEKNKFNQEVIKIYRRRLLYLREKGIEPIIVFHHFTNPNWFAKEGGWTNRKSKTYFNRYIKTCLENFGDYCHYWITFNEPSVYLNYAYKRSIWPPYKNSLFSLKKAGLNIIRAHKSAYKTIHKLQPKSKVGIAYHLINFEPSDKNKLSKLTAKFYSFLFNNLTIRLIGKFQDFIGVSYLETSRVSFSRLKSSSLSNVYKSDLGTEINPRGLLKVLESLEKYRKPILITDNSIADAKDKFRWPYILDSLLMIYAAIAQGLEIIGYIYGNFLDSYEWHQGFEPKLGLVEITESKERKLRQSGWNLGTVSRHNFLPLDTVVKRVKINPEYYPESLNKHLTKITRVKPENG